MLSRQLGIEAGVIALSGAAALLALDNVGKSAGKQTENVTQVFGEVEWITIFFFVGLFVVIAGVEHSGLLRILADQLVGADRRRPAGDWPRDPLGLQRCFQQS